MPVSSASGDGGPRPRDLVRLHLAVAGFGFAGVFGKLIGFGPAAIVAGRAAFAALAIALALVLGGRAGAILPRGGDGRSTMTVNARKTTFGYEISATVRTGPAPVRDAGR